MTLPTPAEHAKAPHLPAHVSWEEFVATFLRAGLLLRLETEVRDDASIRYEVAQVCLPDGFEPVESEGVGYYFSEVGARILLDAKNAIEAVLDDLEADDVAEGLSLMATIDEMVHGPSTGEAPGPQARS